MAIVIHQLWNSENKDAMILPGSLPLEEPDVLKRLQDRLHYLYSERQRYWLDTKPNLHREMESRKQRIDEHSELLPLLKKRTKEALEGRHQFGGVHVMYAVR